VGALSDATVAEYAVLAAASATANVAQKTVKLGVSFDDGYSRSVDLKDIIGVSACEPSAAPTVPFPVLDDGFASVVVKGEDLLDVWVSPPSRSPLAATREAVQADINQLATNTKDFFANKYEVSLHAAAAPC
jgi:hypothetical protein